MTAPRTLVLNQDYRPLCVISWQRAVILAHFENKAEVVKENPHFMVRGIRVSFQAPHVIKLRSYVSQKIVKIRFHKGSVYLRDKGTCQYCASKVTIKAATYDHVLPRAKGGQTSWNNIVIACYKCNQKKNSKTPEEAGMKLLSKPSKPSHLPLAFLEKNKRHLPEEWLEFFQPHQLVDTYHE